ncbi:sulfatase [Actinomadura monticuli]|uniref:Sulfatase n=1 Tax=Actinomadura monticuli TaxID=3097367 RepID=A0ABV4Q7X4_9ACTN
MQPNILFVSLDTVRADVAYNGRMPGIEALRASGVTFRQAISSCPLTPVSHATVFTGLQPPRHGIRHLLREQLRKDVPTLAELLRGAGYSTGAVVSCPGLNRWYGMDRGFDFYDDEIPLLPDGRDPLTVGDVKMRGLALKRAPVVTRRAGDWLAAQRTPFFLFAHFFDAHWPYDPPEDVGVQTRNPYEGEVAYSDHHLQGLLQRLADAGHDPAATLIVLFSDHGEDLGGWYPNDHAGDRGHPEEEGHGCLLFDATQHVPLIFSGPGVRAGVEVPDQVRLVDIMPTVLDLLGLEPQASDGLSLRPLLEGASSPGTRPAAYSETHFPEERTDRAGLHPLRSLRLDDGVHRQKVIWQVGGDEVGYYDLNSDPDEQAARTTILGPDSAP